MYRGSNPRKTWQHINKMLNRKPIKQSQLKIVHDGEELFGLDMANHFNDYFTSIASSLVDELPQSNEDFTINYSPYNFNTSNFGDVSVHEVRDVVLSFKSKKFYMNEIQPTLLCRVLDSITPVLCKLFNLCISNGM